jgi:hypothetical protein
LTESTASANESLSGLDEQMSKSAESTSNLVSSVGSLEKPLQRSGEAVTSVTAALGEQQTVIESAGTAFEGIQKPIESTTALLTEASPPMLAIAQSAESMQKQMSGVNDGFVQISESLSQSVPLLPQFASGLHSVSAEFDPRAFGLDTFNENMSVFQDALVNPEPFSMIQQHLHETGQTWSDFSSSIGSDNATFLQQMTANANVSEKTFGTMSSGAAGVGQTFNATAGETEAFSKQWNELAASVGEVGQAGGMGTALYGPPEAWNKLEGALATTEGSIGKIGAVGGEVAGGGFSLGGLFGGAIRGLESVAMPLMAVQMIGMAVGAVASGIYNMAAAAEGPAAHSVGTFTGAIDQLGQHSASMGQQLSESFGQGILPMLDAMNNTASQSSGGSGGFLSVLTAGVGGTLGILGDLAQIAAGGIIGGAAKVLTMNPSNPTGNDWVSAGSEGLQNLWAQITGSPEPYPTPGSSSTSMQIMMPQIQQSLVQSTAIMNAQATSPQYLAAQAYLQSQTGYAQYGQTAYDISHTSGRSPFDYTPQSYQSSMAGYALANGGSGYGLSDVDLNRAYFSNMLANLPPEFTGGGGGCFPSGTPVLLADGTQRAIEALQIGERVLAHDGIKQVATTIRARILPPLKQVYALVFSDNNTLTLTDSHPISTTQGWKSLSPDATKKENPGLAVAALQIGDRIHTVSGLCELIGIRRLQGLVQVYNIEVGEPHTFYVEGVLVHNKVSGMQIMQNVADTQVPQMDMKNSNLIQSMMGNFSGADLTHTFTATVNWVASGDLAHTFEGAASWVGQGLSNAFTGVASWIGQGLSNAFTGVASWMGQGLTNAFTGTASWIGQGLMNAFTGVASWIGQGLSNTFTGITDWIGQNLEHTFTGVANWITQEVTQVVGSIPGFAAGVEGFSGGLAVVGERGPELAYLPRGTSIYPQSASGGFQPLNIGDTSGPLTITINHTTMLDGRVVAQETIPYIAPILRSVRGIRQ